MTASDGIKTTPTVQIGGLKLTGALALVAAVTILGVIVTLIVWSRPSVGMLISGGIWSGFMIFWSLTAQRGAAAAAEEPARSRAVHQRLLNAGLLLLFVPIPGLQWLWLPEDSHRVPIGLGMQAAATLFHVWARMHLGRNWSSAVMIKTDHQLVRSGPYRLVRHPIYTAILGLAAGTAVVSGQGHALLGLATFAIAYVRKLRLEEHRLGEAFGAAWDAYRRRSWALIPGVF